MGASNMASLAAWNFMKLWSEPATDWSILHVCSTASISSAVSVPRLTSH